MTKSKIMKEELPSSLACQRNKEPIYQVLTQYLTEGNLWEMGFATAEHCEYFGEKFPKIIWYASDHEDYHWIFKERIKKQANVKGPYHLWVESNSFKAQLHNQNINIQFDYFYTANTLHIMSQVQADLFCQQVGLILKNSGLLFLYGPFKFDGQFTSPSNADFDLHLKLQNASMGIRDFERLATNLAMSGLYFERRYDLPANNQLLIFKKNESF